MSSARHAPSAALPMAQQIAYRAAAPMAIANAPAGTFAPGTKVQVGGHRVTIEKYLSEGGFAHVYLVRVPKSDGPTAETAVLKRVAVPDKEALANMRTEVETMKKLKGHGKIVTYMDSHASQLKGGGYEVFLLMEYCSGGGLIDFMNTRLQHRLTEPEILHIFADVAEGVAIMHYLKPPLLHRDLKVENVLITTITKNKVFKLCDFGSTAPPRPAATTAAEGRLIEDDIQRHTTLQYRSPEMIDVYRKQPIDEKSDIWALGVLLYKLCYYTTPFEEVGQMAILNASFKYPSYPQFSDKLKKLIGWMLRENPQQRPNIYQVVAEVCTMRHRQIPIKDIYATRTLSEVRRNQQLPPELGQSTPPVIGLQKITPVKEVQQIPEITPMRRGRPAAPTQVPPTAKPNPSPMGGTTSDPFAALDSQDVQVRRAAADELAARFPSLDEFSLLHDRGQIFEFGQTVAIYDPPLSARVTQALADEAFALPPSSRSDSAPATKASSAMPSANVSRSTSVKKPTPYEARKSPALKPTIAQPKPQHVGMVSTGVQISPRVSPAPPPIQKYPDGNARPIWKVPSPSPHSQSLSQTRSSEFPQETTSLRPDAVLPARPRLDSRSRSHVSNFSASRSPASSRPSLEGQRPSTSELGLSRDRSRSAHTNPRPVSIHVVSDLDYLRDREMAPGRNFNAPSLQRRTTLTGKGDSEDKTVRSSIDFLRSIETDDTSSKSSRFRSSSHSKQGKRESLTNIVKSRFNDAFRRFETNGPTSANDREQRPSTLLLDSKTDPLDSLAILEGVSRFKNEARDALDETEDLSPEVRRELEKCKLEEEERRVEAAAAEYRKQLADRGSGKPMPPTKASTIQNRVKNLLVESNKPIAVSRTAEGYGKYTDTGKPLPTRPQDQSGMRQTHAIAVKPVNISSPSISQETTFAAPSSIRTNLHHLTPSTSLPSTNAIRNVSGPPPPRGPKPKALRSGPSPVKTNFAHNEKPLPLPIRDAGGREEWDVEAFSKKYPNLSGLEMVETEIPRGETRDV